MRLHRLLYPQDPCFARLPAYAALGEAVIAMTRYGKTAVAVMEGDRLAGILTRSDLLTCLQSRLDQPLAVMPLRQVMTGKPVCGDPGESLDQALERMAQARIDHLPVVDAGRLVTVLHQRQLLQARIELLEEAVNHLQEYIDGLHDAAQD
jgi:signal-transduction protein with cAMP-binding, CBS, and nucleotidyltransferase domain